MKPGERLVLLMTTAGLLLLASGVLAQVDGVSTFAETTCDGYQVDIHVTLNVYDVIPADITGWIIEREVLGRCVPNVDVGEVRPMPTDIGEHDFIIRDIPTLPGKAIYHIRAVDEGGTRLVGNGRWQNSVWAGKSLMQFRKVQKNSASCRGPILTMATMKAAAFSR